MSTILTNNECLFEKVTPEYILEDDVIVRLATDRSFRVGFLKVMNKKYLKVSRLGKFKTEGYYDNRQVEIKKLPCLKDPQEVGVFAEI